MKNPLQNLLFFLSACLCVLIAFQWHREAKLRLEVQRLTNAVQDKLEHIRTRQHELRRAEEEIKRVDGLRSELLETVKSNRTQIARMLEDLERSDQEVEKGIKRIEVYKAALQQANENIKTQGEGIRTQNENVKKLSAEYGDLLAKYNKVVGEFNALAKKWNDAQTADAPAATNPPAKK